MATGHLNSNLAQSIKKAQSVQISAQARGMESQRLLKARANTPLVICFRTNPPALENEVGD